MDETHDAVRAALAARVTELEKQVGDMWQQLADKRIINARLEADCAALREALKTVQSSMKDLRRAKAAHIKIGMDMLAGIVDEALARRAEGGGK